MAGYSSDFRLSKCVKSGEVSVESDEDRFKQLPSSLLVNILSFLPIDHSARMSILSKYWRGLWISSLRLKFDASDLHRKLKASKLSKTGWGGKYVEWVNKILCAHQALHSDKEEVIEEFRICFELDQLYHQHIDSWLRYAFSIKVRCLELNLLKHNKLQAYCFPGLLDPSSDEYSDKTSAHRNPLVLSEFRILKSLSLAGINVTGEAIDFLLCKFPLLERLKVCNSGDLASVKLCSQSLALKHLEITHCMDLRSIIVRDSRLVSLKITRVPNLVLENVPMLVGIWISAERIREILPQFYTCLSKLKNGAKVHMIPQFPELKQLVLTVNEIENGSLAPLSSLLRSTPNLEKFVLKVKDVKDMIMTDVDYEKPLNLPFQHLKALELRGYHGHPMEDEVVTYLQSNSKALGRIVLETADKCVWRFPATRHGNQGRTPVVEECIRDKAKACAEKLRGVLPSSVKLVVL